MQRAIQEIIHVKLIPEEAGAISILPVVVREMSFEELLEQIVAQVGKDTARVKRLLRSGTLVSGATRYRWEGLDVDENGVVPLLQKFPDPEPERPFSSNGCTLAVFHDAAGRSAELPREVAARRRWFRRRSFWDACLEAIPLKTAGYLSYSYREKADCYRVKLPARTAAAIRDRARLLNHSGYRRYFRVAEWVAVELYVPRS